MDEPAKSRFLASWTGTAVGIGPCRPLPVAYTLDPASFFLIARTERFPPRLRGALSQRGSPCSLCRRCSMPRLPQRYRPKLCPPSHGTLSRADRGIARPAALYVGHPKSLHELRPTL